MPNWLRSVSAVVAGIVASLLVIVVAEVVSAGLFPLPLPRGTDTHDMKAMKAAMAAMPVGAYLTVLSGWSLGTFLGSIVAALIAQARDRPRGGRRGPLPRGGRGHDADAPPPLLVLGHRPPRDPARRLPRRRVGSRSSGKGPPAPGGMGAARRHRELLLRPGHRGARATDRGSGPRRGPGRAQAGPRDPAEPGRPISGGRIVKGGAAWRRGITGRAVSRPLRGRGRETAKHVRSSTARGTRRATALGPGFPATRAVPSLRPRVRGGPMPRRSGGGR